MAEQKKLLNKAEINSQEHFDMYINRLSSKDRCCFMKGMELDLCDDLRFNCQFRGSETYSLMSGRTMECRRPRVMKFKKMFGK